MDLVIAIYRTTEAFPSQETYGLTNQIRRAAVSVPSNIAEGAARQTKKEFTNDLHIDQASLSELDTQVELASRLGYLNELTPSGFDETMELVKEGVPKRMRS